jgi:hypothetical protein
VAINVRRRTFHRMRVAVALAEDKQDACQVTKDLIYQQKRLAGAGDARQV